MSQSTLTLLKLFFFRQSEADNAAGSIKKRHRISSSTFLSLFLYVQQLNALFRIAVNRAYNSMWDIRLFQISDVICRKFDGKCPAASSKWDDFHILRPGAVIFPLSCPAVTSGYSDMPIHKSSSAQRESPPVP